MKITQNGDTTIPTLPGAEYVFAANGTFGGGALAVSYSLDGVAFTNFSDGNVDVILTSSGGRILTSPSTVVRLTLANATAPSIDVSLVPKV